MRASKASLRRFAADSGGTSVAEYATLLALVLTVALAAVNTFGARLAQAFASDWRASKRPQFAEVVLGGNPATSQRSKVAPPWRDQARVSGLSSASSDPDLSTREADQAAHGSWRGTNLRGKPTSAPVAMSAVAVNAAGAALPNAVASGSPLPPGAQQSAKVIPFPRSSEKAPTAPAEPKTNVPTIHPLLRTPPVLAATSVLATATTPLAIHADRRLDQIRNGDARSWTFFETGSDAKPPVSLLTESGGASEPELALARPSRPAPTKDENLSPDDSALWDKCRDLWLQYKEHSDKNSWYRKMDEHICKQLRFIDSRIKETALEVQKRQGYLDMDCDKFDWYGTGTKQSEREASHRSQRDEKVSALQKLGKGRSRLEEEIAKQQIVCP